jgi:hypothetical protein
MENKKDRTGMVVFVVLCDLVGGQNWQTKVGCKCILGGLKAYLRSQPYL